MSREMKHSGIDWIGDIPKEWKLGRYKYFGRFTKGKLPSNTNDEQQGAPIIGASEMLGKQCRTYTVDTNVPMCSPNDILILWDGANAGIVANGCEGVLSSTAVVYSCLDKRFNEQFLFYLLKNGEPFFKSKVNGTTIPHMNSKYLDDYVCLLPPLSEQQKIADYLDKVCGEIDGLVALQEAMIDELKAYKQSVITEAVTKGLNPNVTLKPSGIDWIGDIPEHWEIEPLKYCFGRRSEKNNPVKTEERLSLSIDKGVTLYADKTTNLDRFKDDFTQYQLAYPNDIVLNCMNMIVGAVGLSNYLGCVSPVYYVIYPLRLQINALYYSYLLNIPTIRGVYYSLGKGIYAIERGEGRVNTCRLKVAYGDFGRLSIPIPPIEEQKEITQHIQKTNAEIDSLIAIKQQKIGELKEYKKSVIYEYVTGKKEVV
jgi:type I restriction enzyme S subunit